MKSKNWNSEERDHQASVYELLIKDGFNPIEATKAANISADLLRFKREFDKR